MPLGASARKPPSVWVIGLILTFGYAAARVSAQDAPPDLARRIAHMETETQAARNQYTYRQSVRFMELDTHGAETGEYREERDVIFSPEHERTEQLIGRPADVKTPEADRRRFPGYSRHPAVRHDRTALELRNQVPRR